MICDTFKHLAHETWNKIDNAKRVGFQLKEETFTDINLLELKLHHPSEVLICEFTKKEEGTNGADWEWWFTNDRSWIGFRVQAKIINVFSQEFEHLHYQKQDSLPQSEKLILQAENNGKMPRIPLYCLFMSTDQFKECDDIKLFGCSLMSAYDVRTLRKERKARHILDVQDHIFPWHKLVCHPENISLLQHVTSFVNDMDKGEIGIREYLIEEPPYYVTALLRSNSKNLNFEGSPKSLAGVMVIKSRR
jgi:hypothetical protein